MAEMRLGKTGFLPEKFSCNPHLMRNPRRKQNLPSSALFGDGGFDLAAQPRHASELAAVPFLH
jgi:hypothetical protein